MKLSAAFESYRIRIEAALPGYLDRLQAPERLVAAMRYSLMAGGKRIRPILVLAAHEMVQGRSQQAVPVACAMEMIHTYSLIHDDLPSMDNADLRRGNPSCHVRFDEATALLAGNGLLTEAFRLIADVRPETVVVRVMSEVAVAIGAEGMMGGQQLDTENSKRQPTQADLETLHRLKTGRLIAASMVVGGFLGEATVRDLDRLRSFGESLGLMFQLVDDLLDATSDPSQLGKTTHLDARNKKETFVSLLGIDGTKRLIDTHTAAAVAALEPFGQAAVSLSEYARVLATRQS